MIDEVNCFDGNVTQNTFTASVCFDPASQTAQQACNTICNNSTTYLLAPLVGNGVVSCGATVQNDDTAADGQCSTSTSASGGKTSAVTCTLGGRQCTNLMQTPDGTEIFCGTMATHTFAITPTSTPLKGCYDPTVESAQTFCQNMFTWPDNPVTNRVSTTEFPWVNVTNVTAHSTACSTTATSSALLLAVAAGSQVGTLQAKGTTTALTAKGGFFSTSTHCDSDNEFCTTSLDDLKLTLNNITIAGVTISNAEIGLVSPVSLGSVNANQTIQPNTMILQVSGDIAGFRRPIVNIAVPTATTVTSTATSMSMTGSFPAVMDAADGSVVQLNITTSISGTKSTNPGCSTQTALQALLGFESTQYWSSSQAPLSLDGDLHTQGCFGLDVGGSGYRTLNSTAVQTPIPGTTSKLALDVFVPPNQPNPFWLGAVQMYLTCPSANQFNMYIGQAELTGKPTGQFSTLSYPVPAAILSVLNGSHPDCFFSIAVNTNQTPTPPVLDNLRFQ